MRALDLFAGTGWGVACRRLGIEELGVEIMPEVVATRDANGMKTIYRDVWDGLMLSADAHEELYGSYELLIASPPCQTFSTAGKGAGRAALDEVIEAVELHAYKDPQQLRDFGERHDPRTALVLTPLAYIHRDRPRYVALEQVPSVLPVWEAYATVMRGWGYDVKTAVLYAEQYGVPQTRKRAILVATLGGEARLPVPTHSRYYSRTPDKLDAGVLRWVSMAEALGWHREGVTFTQNNRQPHQAVRTMDQPAPTVTAGHDSGNRGFMEDGAFTVANPDQVAALQSYPTSLVSNYGTGGISTNRGRRTPDQPAPTLTTKAGRNKWDTGDKMSALEASLLQTYPSELRPELAAWKWIDAPATTVAGDPRITAREHHYHGEQSKTSLRLNQAEAEVLQTFPTEPPFIWCGTKTKVFLQIGNAVPPLLAQAILAALLHTPSQDKQCQPAKGKRRDYFSQRPQASQRRPANRVRT